MTSNDLINLYTKQDDDEIITPFSGELGFSLVKPYPQKTTYHNDGRIMFIKIAIIDQGFYYSIQMTTPEKRGDVISYIITDGEKYKNKVTNFTSDYSEFEFNVQQKYIKHKITNKYLAMNEFVDILVGNHLTDRLFIKRKLNKLVDKFLKILFWLSDRHYEKVQIMLDRYHFDQNKKTVVDERKTIEPFFNYFYISKNLMFFVLLATFIMAIFISVTPLMEYFTNVWHSVLGEFTLSNPLLILFVFLILFSTETISVWLNKNINSFLKPEKDTFYDQKKTFIEDLVNYEHNSKFNLKLNLKGSLKGWN